MSAVNEFFSTDEVTYLSCDDKNKVPIGLPMVSKFVKGDEFFVEGLNPLLEDHNY